MQQHVASNVHSRRFTVTRSVAPFSGKGDLNIVIFEENLASFSGVIKLNIQIYFSGYREIEPPANCEFVF